MQMNGSTQQACKENVWQQRKKQASMQAWQQSTKQASTPASCVAAEGADGLHIEAVDLLVNVTAAPAVGGGASRRCGTVISGRAHHHKVAGESDRKT